MALPKIQPTDYANKGIRVKPNPLGISVSDAQRAFDELSLDVVIPKVNEIAEAQDAVNKTFQLKETGKGLSQNDFTNGYKQQLDQLPTDLNGKVDKVEGKGLSTNDFTTVYKQQLDNLSADLNGKVDKVEGKGLSECDFTADYRNFLRDNLLIEMVANGKVLSDYNFTKAYKSALDDLPTAFNLKADTDDVLTKTNTTPFTPTGDYQPATKQYVDQNVIAGGVPQTRTINGYSLENDVNLKGADIKFIDDTTSKIYVLGIDNGGLYYKEVIS